MNARHTPSARDLPYGEFALALYASDTLPLPRTEPPSLSELIECAERGLRIIGGHAKVVELHTAMLRANERLLRGQVEPDEHAKVVRDLLREAIPTIPANIKRLERCTGYDFRRLILRRGPVGDRCASLALAR